MSESRWGRYDRARLDPSNEEQLRRWSDRYGVSPDRLREVVKQVGPESHNIEFILGDRRRWFEQGEG